jgi:hypothetical protein
MNDIYGGMIGLLLISSMVGILLGRATADATSRTRRLGMLLLVLALILYTAFVWDRVWLTQLLPVSNLIVVGNLFPLLAAALAGLIYHELRAAATWRRWLNLTALGSMSLLAMFTPLIGSPPDCGNAWLNQQICLQTTDRTCTPACAATLLRHHGINATEQEMAQLCLTRGGTTWQGLYRGLKRKTAQSAWDVRIEQMDIHQLRQLGSTPAILRLGGAGFLSTKNGSLRQRDEMELGLRSGIGHSVILLRFLNDQLIEVADPKPGVGIEVWTAEELSRVWDGEVTHLVSRRGA